MAIADNLSAIWRMDEASGTRVNSYGAAPDLSENNGVTSATGQVGNGAVTTRTPAVYLSCASHASLQISPATSMTWTCWVKPTAAFASQVGVFEKDGGNIGQLREYSCQINAGKPTLYIFDGDSTGFAQIIGDYTLIVGQWAFLAYRWDHAANQGSVKVNGGAVKSGSGPALGPATGDAPITIGGRVGTTLHGADLVIDEVCVWQRALSLSELGFMHTLGSEGRSLADFLAGGGGIPLSTLRRFATRAGLVRCKG